MKSLSRYGVAKKQSYIISFDNMNQIKLNIKLMDD